MDFEWNDDKAEANLVKHGIDFVDAARVFLDPHRIERLDDREEYGEDRFQTIGAVRGRTLLVVFADREDVIRIISARPTTQREREAYEAARGSEEAQAGRTDWKRVDSLSEAQIESAARKDRDARPLSARELASMDRLPDVRIIRSKLGMTQEQFAENFHLSLATIRDWEQGRFQPDRAARTLLRLIATIPNQVRAALK